MHGPTLRAGVITALLTMLLSGCGFHLRGAMDIPEHLKQVELQGQLGGATAKGVRRLLLSNGVELSTGQGQSPYRLIILSEKHERKAATLNTQAKTEEYELRAQVAFELRDAEGKIRVPKVNLLVERVYTFDENNIAAKDAEEALLRKEMSNDLARQVVRRYLNLPRN